MSEGLGERFEAYKKSEKIQNHLAYLRSRETAA